MRILGLALASVVAFSATQASAIELLTGMGGTPADFGQITQPRNDDGSSSRITLPFAINFFGETFDGLFVNNNGNVTFRSTLSAFTPTAFPVTNQPMIAPFWGDVDTRNPTSGQVYIGALGIGGRQSTVVTWNDVGYFNTQADKLNNFQLVLIDRNDTGSGNFDIQFRYDRLEWTTGSASGGVGGLGGTPAQAGYDAGNGVDFFTLPGSRTADVLELANTSNVSLETPGLWQFQIRSGEIGVGVSPEAPLLPDVVDEDGFQFTFDILPNTPIFIDPVVAIGYDYVVNSGPNILSAWFSDVGDADGYQVFGWDGDGFDIFLGDVMAETWFDFGGTGVTRFGLRGIDSALGLDPNDPTAFVTGLTFATGGTVDMTMTPFTFDTGGGTPGAIPEPATWAMLIAGFGLVGAMARRRRALAA